MKGKERLIASHWEAIVTEMFLHGLSFGSGSALKIVDGGVNLGSTDRAAEMT